MMTFVKVVEAIQNAGKTGKIGDGKIFISDLSEVIRIVPARLVKKLYKRNIFKRF